MYIVTYVTWLYCSNEEEVGVAIRESGIPREEIFVVTKVSCHVVSPWYIKEEGSDINSSTVHEVQLLTFFLAFCC